MSEFFEFGEDAVEELEFATGPEDPLMVGYVIVVFKEHVGVVAAFAELHHEVSQGVGADFAGVVVELEGSLAGYVVIDDALPG